MEDVKALKKQPIKAYEVDLVRNLYIHGDKPLQHWAKELGLSVRELNKIAVEDSLNWHALRNDFQEKRMRYFKNMSKDVLVERQSLIYRIEMLTLLSLHHKANEIEEHYKTYGDFYLRNDDGEFLLDNMGRKTMIRIPNSPTELMSLKGMEDIRVNNEKFLADKVTAETDEKRTVETKKTVDGLFVAEIDE